MTQNGYAPPDRREYTVAKIIPPRVGEKTLSATENLISSVSSEDNVLSFEMVGTHNGVALMHRAERDDALFRTMMTAHFPSAIVEAVPPDADPLVPGPDEDAWTCTLKVDGAPYLPLRIFSNLDVQADHGADPMAAVIGAHANFDAHERVVSRFDIKNLWRTTGRSLIRGLDWEAQVPTTQLRALRNSVQSLHLLPNRPQVITRGTTDCRSSADLP